MKGAFEAILLPDGSRVLTLRPEEEVEIKMTSTEKSPPTPTEILDTITSQQLAVHISRLPLLVGEIKIMDTLY